VLTIGAALGVVGVYVFGLSQPARHVVGATDTWSVPPAEVWALLSDPLARPRWRPDVDRIALISETAEGATYRELDAGGDRFDFRVVDVVLGRRLTLEVAAPEQIGFHGGWTWELAPVAEGTRVTVTEDGTIDNPLFRGIYGLTRSQWATVEQELRLLGGHLDVAVHPERSAR